MADLVETPTSAISPLVTTCGGSSRDGPPSDWLPWHDIERLFHIPGLGFKICFQWHQREPPDAYILPGLASSRRPCHHHFCLLANHATLPLRPELQQCTNASPRAHLRQGRWILFSTSYGTPRRGLMVRVASHRAEGHPPGPPGPRFNPYARHWWGSKLTHPPKGSSIPSCITLLE